MLENCTENGIGFQRPGTPPSSNYSNHILVANNRIQNIGIGNSPANPDDLTIYANYLTIEHNDLGKAGDDAMDAWGDHITVRGNSIHDVNNTAGIHNDVFQTWTGINDGAEGNPITNFVFEQNTIKNITGPNSHGLMIEGPGHENWIVRNNLFQNIGSYGLNICTGVKNINVYNNTFYEAGGADAIGLGGCNSLHNSGTVADNIFANGNGAIYGAGGEVKEGYNQFYNMKEDIPSGTGDKVENPLFVNPGSDFHLQTGSPALGSGDNGAIINPTDPYDLEGNPWGSSSRGAYR